jgi:hypothetical protein
MSKQNDLTSVLRAPLQPSSGNVEGLEANVTKLAKSLALSGPATNRLRTVSLGRGVTILNDAPTKDDSFHFDHFVRTLADIAVSPETQTPISIGLDGAWGTGKTSIMQMIEAHARLADHPCIWLNAWSLDNTENLLITVAKEIQRECEYLDEKLHAPQRITTFLRNALASVAEVRLIGLPISLRLGKEMVDKIKERGTRLQQLASLATTRQSFQELVDLLLKYHEGTGRRLIVFVDDVDRALPDQVADVLKILKLILETPGCVFVLGMDMRIVARSIESFYQEHQIIESRAPVERRANWSIDPRTDSDRTGYRFLEKLVQIHVRVPALTREAVEGYLQALGIASEVAEIVRWAPDEDTLNPRRLKRYINRLSISLQFIMASIPPESLSNRTALRLIALKRDYPQIYDELLEGAPEPRVDAFDQKRRLVGDSHEQDRRGFRQYIKDLGRDTIKAFDAFVSKTPFVCSAAHDVGDGEEI